MCSGKRNYLTGFLKTNLGSSSSHGYWIFFNQELFIHINALLRDTIITIISNLRSLLFSVSRTFPLGHPCELPRLDKTDKRRTLRIKKNSPLAITCIWKMKFMLNHKRIVLCTWFCQKSNIGTDLSLSWPILALAPSVSTHFFPHRVLFPTLKKRFSVWID